MPTCHTPMHSANLESMTGCCRSMRTAGKLACGEALAARHQALAARHQHPLHAQSHAHRERKIAKQQQSTQIACACRTACACLECGRARSGLLKVLRQALSGAESSERRERHRSTGRQQESCARGEQASSARESESKSETLGREPRWEGGGDREGVTEQDLTELGAAALTTASLSLVVGTQGDLLCLELRAADATLPPQPLVLAKLRSAARLACACMRTCTRVTCLYPYMYSRPQPSYAYPHMRTCTRGMRRGVCTQARTQTRACTNASSWIHACM